MSEDDGTSTGGGPVAGRGAGSTGTPSVVDFGVLDDARESTRAAVEVVDLSSLGEVVGPSAGPEVVDFESVAGPADRRSAAQSRTRSAGPADGAPRRRRSSRPVDPAPVDAAQVDPAPVKPPAADEHDGVARLWPAEDADPLAAGSRSAESPAGTRRSRRPASSDDDRRSRWVAAADREGPGQTEAATTEVGDDGSGDGGGDSAGRSGRSGSGSSGKSRSGSFGRSGSGSFGKSRSGSFGKSGSGSFGASGSSSFGDSASRLGRGSRRSGSSGGKRREWGIQLDAEVEEPVPGVAAAEGSGATGAEDQAPAGGRHDRSTRTANRGRAGSFGRPRRAEGEPPPEFDDPEQTAKQICLTALTGASRSRQQLAELLAAREIPDEVAATVLDRFTEVGLVDDAAFAAAWVSSRQSTRGLSRRALSHELRAKGIDPEVASVALEAVDPQDEWDTARALVARKVPGMRRLDTATATRRLTGMLARKGYGMGLAAWVVREALEADGTVEDAAAEADDAAPDLAGVEPAGDGPAVRRGLWSGRPLGEDTDGEVGEGLTVDGVARSRSAAPHPGGFGRR
ncbi:SOS response regulatory protein OraA/RecX, interacts with RecA [Klenkia soli]|uniref:Regulatory protein RecX n=1 Tax=Klenkia soli TaxID=1052260 RepID=A0A1H0SFU4_9ACTN|nr:regulatory protein RecX [Klenkia soli]SDP40118.1 SOS response regulatory protein OraA/RecX, interacts with RecA [Klenkia soli]